MVALPKKDFHLHPDRLAAEITKRLRMPHLFLNEVEHDCWRGKSEDLVIAFARIAATTKTRTITSPRADIIMTDTPQAIIELANSLAGDKCTVGELNSALLMILEILPDALRGELHVSAPTADFFDGYHLQRQAKVALLELRKSTTESDFDRAYERVMEVNRLADEKLGEPTLYRYVESTWYQALQMRQSEADLRQHPAGPHPAALIGRLLAEAYDEDGRFTRTDEEFDNFMAMATSKVDTINTARAKLNQAMMNFIRELTDRPDVAADVQYKDGVAPDLATWSKFNINIVSGPFEKSFTIMIDGLDPEDPEDALDMLSAIIGGHRG